MLDFSEIWRQLTFQAIANYFTIFVHNVIIALIIYIVGKFIIKKVSQLVRKMMQKKNVEPSLYSFLDSTISICLYFVLIIAIISVLGIETSSFVALFASAGVAIGMALSGTLQNFAGGVMILLFRPFKVGDYIEAQGYAGSVKQIQIFNTVLTTVDNQTIIIPNGGLSTGSMKNFSTQTTRRVDININLPYGTDTDKVRKILADICSKDSRIKNEGSMAPAYPMTSLGENAVTIQLRVWTDSKYYWGVLEETNDAIYQQLTAAGISNPAQKVDVRMKS